MKRLVRFFLLLLCFSFIFSKSIYATSYEITHFDAQITLNKNTSLTIKETIDVNFLTSSHGIFRVIPYIYSHNGKTINSRLKVISVTDAQGLPVEYKIKNIKQSKQLKIGNANYTVIGPQRYLIEYQVDDVVLDYGQGPEIYWNITGTEWEVPIQKATATIFSPFGSIVKTDCFGCQSNFTSNNANFNGEMGLTVVVQIDSTNNLVFKSNFNKIITLIVDNIGYFIAIIPNFILFYFWFKKGRDQRYLSQNVFYQPDDKTTKAVSIFHRPHLPLVYAPIDGFSPAEIGAIIDQKVDTKDIVAEIIELARLGFLTIKKIETKGLLGVKSVDYQLIKLDKNPDNLNKFQASLLSKIFSSKDETKISLLKNHFYTHLPDLKNKLYDQLVIKKITKENIDKVRSKWSLFAFLLNLIAFFIVYHISNRTQNSNPIFFSVISFVISFIFAYQMPQKTALGYNLYRQAVGLRYYLNKGKWREEIMEKNLFLEEMLPLAISLGVVNKLAKEMKSLGVNPPSYLQGITIHSFVNDLNSFTSSATTSLASSPSGNSSWSGGSGFSDSSSGGGFGGGGGGSW